MEKTIEDQLKELIIDNFKSVRQFANHVDIPSTTIDTILKRGVGKASIANIITICRALNLDVDELASGRLTPRKTLYSIDLTYKENQLIEKLRSLTEYEQETVEIIVNRFLDNQTTIKIEETPLRYVTLPAYGYAPSAGTGNYMPDDIPASTIQVPESPLAEKADFVVKVGGHSMEPKFMDGDLVLVKKAEVLDPGKIGIFSVNGEALIKEYFPDRLHSLNARYKDIDLNDGDTVRCLGEVIGKL